jgi:hypothetical protein
MAQAPARVIISKPTMKHKKEDNMFLNSGVIVKNMPVVYTEHISV